MRSLLFFLIFLVSISFHSHSQTDSPIKISKFELKKVKLLSELITTIPKGCQIVSTEFLLHVGGNICVHESKNDQLDSLTLSYFSRVDKKSKIYIDIFLSCPQKKSYNSTVKLID